MSSLLRNYEIMILLTEEFNDSELKAWVFNYARNLRKFNVCDISVISRGKHDLAYSIFNETTDVAPWKSGRSGPCEGNSDDVATHQAAGDSLHLNLGRTLDALRL